LQTHFSLLSLHLILFYQKLAGKLLLLLVTLLVIMGSLALWNMVHLIPFSATGASVPHLYDPGGGGPW
jgi:hypothetical protein